MFLNNAGDIFISDNDSNRIRKVDSRNGIVTTIVGGGTPIDGLGDEGPAIEARLFGPEGLFIDSNDDLFIADMFNNRIRKVVSNLIVDADVIEVSGKVKSVDTESNTITITTVRADDLTFSTNDKTDVIITDIDGVATKTDIASVLSIEKDGDDVADSAVITTDDTQKFAKKIDVTTTRRMTFTNEEVEARTNEITDGNKDVVEQAKLKVDNHGTIKGRARVMTGSQADIIVYIEVINGNNFTPVPKQHVPDGAENVKTKAKGDPSEFPMMDQLNIAFTPHILPVLKGSVVDFPNSDAVRHKVFSLFPIPGTDERIDLGTYDPGIIKTVNFGDFGGLQLLCHIHNEESGFIIVLNNPYFTVTDESGDFTIENVPAGNYILKTWHERFESETAEVTVEAGQTVEITLPTMKRRKDTFFPTPEPSPTQMPTITTVPTITSTPAPTSSPAMPESTQTPTPPPSGKSFIFNCEYNLRKGTIFGLEKLIMAVGDTENCTLKHINHEPGKKVEISSLLRKGLEDLERLIK